MAPESLKVATNKNVEQIAKLESEQVEVVTLLAEQESTATRRGRSWSGSG
jgi:hypothetical protein